MLQVFATMHQSTPSIMQEAVTTVLMRKQTFLNHVQKPIDRQRDRRDDCQHEQNRLAMSATLRNVNNIAESANRAALSHKFRQHDVSERQPEQQPKRIE